MKSPEVRQSSKHHEKKKSRRSPSSSRSSGSPQVQRNKKRRHDEEHKKRHEEASSSRKQDDRERHLTDKNRDRSRDGTRNESRDSKKRSPSRERDRDRRQDRRRDEEPGRRRENRGERWEDEERRYPPKVKQEAGSDDERDYRRGGPSHRGGPPHRGGPSQRGGRGQRGRNRVSSFNSRVKEESFDWGKAEHREEKPQAQVDKEQPNFGLSGKLTEATNTVNGVVVKYSEPPEARKPTRRWRFYVFKGEETMPTLYIHRQSAYLIGKDRRVADIRLDHPSVSAQHAALQYRLVSTKSEDGLKSVKAIRPYVIDLESSNGTFLNNSKIEPKKYVELREKDVLKFGFSSREYVVLHEHSQDDDSAEEFVDEGPN